MAINGTFLSSKPEVREGALAPEVTYFGGHIFGDVFLVWEGGTLRSSTGIPQEYNRIIHYMFGLFRVEV